MIAIKIDVFSHNVKVHGFGYRGKEVLLEFCRTLAQYGMTRAGHNRYVRTMLRVYAATTADRREFRFQRSQLDDLVAHLKYHGFMDNNIEINYRSVPVGVEVDMMLDPNLKPYDYQVPLIDFLSQVPAADVMAPDERTKVTTLQTGKGKTNCSLMACARIGKRVMLILKGMYVDKWISDVKKAYKIEKDDLLVIRGSADLKTLMQMAQAGVLNAKFIICTNKTLYNYLEAYEQYREDIVQLGYSILPENLFGELGVGVRLIDEVHMDFHLNYRLDLYTNVELTINLSATLESDDKFMNRMYEVAFPNKTRFGMEYDKYIAVRALTYRINDMRTVRWKAKGRGSYSHLMFEESIMKNKTLLDNYLNMITNIVENSYVSKCEEGQKMLVFAYTVELCGIIAKHLASKYPSLKINRYTAEEKYEVLLESDISVSTIKSAGTAVDIPGLIAVLMTDALGSRQGNSQALGRLRKFVSGPWTGLTPHFYYLVCLDIPKHIEYHERKIENFSNKALSHKTLTTSFRI